MREVDAARIKELFYRKLQDEKTVKRTRKPLFSILIAAVLIFAGAMTIFGQDILKSIREYLAGGNINYFVVDSQKYLPLPEELSGMVFDMAGNELDAYIPGETKFYNIAGDELFMFINNGGGWSVGSREEYDKRMSEIYVTFNDPEEALRHFIGDARIPSYVPEGMRLAFIQFQDIYGTLYAEGNDYMTYTYVGADKIIYVNVKNMGETGAVGYYTVNDGSFDTDPAETLINGHKTTIVGKRLHIEIDNIMYSFTANDNVSVGELIKIAESL